ncbi:hypothetical protein [Nocardia flavorosea]|uniref:Uncharacterized protein n=1 Tax=Nocardia flavorosea TaxID=53429 RepID=A0A846YSJ9_9NOCA|nr:hypothetical protein [Nocardia flavorosea]NKY60418.1 hypothetical protein [Nocardia flavorosea]
MSANMELLCTIQSASLGVSRELRRLDDELLERREIVREPLKNAIRAALDAGVPRKDIASAAGFSWMRCYQLIGGRASRS